MKVIIHHFIKMTQKKTNNKHNNKILT